MLYYFNLFVHKSNCSGYNQYKQIHSLLMGLSHSSPFLPIFVDVPELDLHHPVLTDAVALAHGVDARVGALAHVPAVLLPDRVRPVVAVVVLVLGVVELQVADEVPDGGVAEKRQEERGRGHQAQVQAQLVRVVDQAVGLVATSLTYLGHGILEIKHYGTGLKLIR